MGEALGEGPPVSGLVDRRRDGKWTYYSVPNDPPPPIAGALEFVMSSVKDDEAVAGDRKNITKLECCGEDCRE
jgi:hypothetical protein